RISSITQGERNMQEAYGKATVQDAALQEMMGMAQRIVEISSAHGSADANTQAILEAEAAEIATAATNLQGSLFYNDTAIAATTVVNVDGTNTVTFNLATMANIDFTTADGTSVSTAQDLVDLIATEMAVLGGSMRGMEAQSATLAGRKEAHVMGESAIRDTDIAAESTRLTRAQILSQSNVAMLAQANARPLNLLALLR
ncbi:MAG: flagellin, partial [Candidatus Sericytochromatia bacterium]|nr:flagellin [Candidatus Sericytochromatia bacterium]